MKNWGFKGFQVEMNNDIMNKLMNIVWSIIILQAFCLILSYSIDWTITHNVFALIGTCGCFFVFGLLTGKILTEEKMNEKKGDEYNYES